MELFKHKNHRNSKYLNWLRQQNCVVSGKKAQCAHHIRLGTNGGSSIKPSDYFCIPLLNEFHTTGPDALHIIGEETFLKQFKLNKIQLFNYFLKKYLKEEFNTLIDLNDQTELSLLKILIELIEKEGPSIPKTKKKKPSIAIDPAYQKAKEIKKAKDKEIRQSLNTFKGNEFYEKAKELKRQRDKELRQSINKKTTQKKSSNTEYYLKAKEAKKEQNKEFKEKQKQLMSAYRKEQYKKLKELKKQSQIN